MTHWKAERSRCVSGEKQQELPRSYQGSKQSQEVTPIWKTEERKKSVSMVYPVPLSSKTLVMVRSEAGWGSIHLNFLERSSEGYVQSDPVGDMNDYFQVGNIFRILKRTRIDLELRSQWPEVGVVGVTACAPASTHFSDFILQTTRLFLVSQDVCELTLQHHIFFFILLKYTKVCLEADKMKLFSQSSPSACKGAIQVLQHSHLLTEQPQQGLFSLKQT